MDITKGNWEISHHGGAVVTDILPDKRAGYDLSDFESERKYYGGYIICESIMSIEDARLISAAPDMYDAIRQILSAINTHDKEEYFNGINSAKKSLLKITKPAMELEAKITIVNRTIEETLDMLKKHLSSLRDVANLFDSKYNLQSQDRLQLENAIHSTEDIIKSIQ